MNKQDIKYLVDNKKAIIKKKRALPVKFAPAFGFVESEHTPKLESTKAVKMEHDEERKAVKVKVIANLTGWMDYDDDVILRGAYNKSIADKEPSQFPFLKDHTYKMDAMIGDTLKVYTEEYRMRELGYNSDKSAQALIFEAMIPKGYDSSMYEKYKSGAVKQHSIGLRYIKIDLAVNDSQYSEEKALWDKYIDQVVNLEKALDYGYFWAVQEIAVVENSAVIFGSNSMTPTLSIQQEEKGQTEAALRTSASETKEAVQKDTSDILNFFKHL